MKSPILARTLRHMGQTLIRIAELIESGDMSDEKLKWTRPELVRLPTENAEVPSSRKMESFSPRLADEAKAIYTARRSRADHIKIALDNEAAWDIMLDLYWQAYNGRHVSISSACIASAVAPTTALRWIDVLIKEGYTERAPSAHDKRRHWLSLTMKGKLELERFLFDALGRREREGRMAVDQCIFKWGNESFKREEKKETEGPNN